MSGNRWDKIMTSKNGNSSSNHQKGDESSSSSNADSLLSLESLSINCTSVHSFITSMKDHFEERFKEDKTISDEIKKNIRDCFSNLIAASKLLPRLAAKQGLDTLYTSPEDMLLLADVNIKLVWDDAKIIYHMISHSLEMIAKTSKHDAVKHAIVLYKNIVSKDHKPDEMDRVAKEVVREIPGFLNMDTRSTDDKVGKTKDIKSILAKL